jgi:TPR repeat protein
VWYRRAAESGNANAQNNLARMYEDGRGVPKDYSEAVKWFHRAADQGVAAAQFNLGRAFEIGRGVPKDYKRRRSGIARRPIRKTPLRSSIWGRCIIMAAV